MVKNLPAGTGDAGSIPDAGRIPLASEQLSLCTTMTKHVF